MWLTLKGRPSNFASVETKKTALRLHHLDKTEHFVRTFIKITLVVIGITLIVIGHRVVGLKIFAPELVDFSCRYASHCSARYVFLYLVCEKISVGFLDCGFCVTFDVV